MGDASSERYFIRRNGAVKGPYSLAKVESGLASGKLRDSDKIAASESGPWETLGRWIRNATTDQDDDSSEDLIGQPYDDETDLDELARVVRNAKPVLRQQAATPKVEFARPTLRQRIEESGVEVDWDVLLGNLKKLALILGGVAAVGLTIWFGIPLASRAVQDTIQQVNEFQEAVAQVEALQPAVEAHNDNDKPGRRSNDKPQKELFEPAIRSAMAYDGGVLTDSKLPLTNELRLIEPSLRSDADHQVFKILKLIEGLQNDTRLLVLVRRLQREGLANLAKSANVEVAKIDSQQFVVGSLYGSKMHQQLLEANELFSVAKQLSDNDCIVLTMQLEQSLFSPLVSRLNKGMDIAGVQALAAKYKVEPQSSGRITYIPTGDLVATLHAGTQKLIDEVNRLRLGKGG
jgi:hypothetical protein